MNNYYVSNKSVNTGYFELYIIITYFNIIIIIIIHKINDDMCICICASYNTHLYARWVAYTRFPSTD